MKILAIQVVRRVSHPDKVYLRTNLPDPYKEGENLDVVFDAPSGDGIKYCADQPEFHGVPLVLTEVPAFRPNSYDPGF